MIEALNEPVARLLAHYHSQLLATPALCTVLDRLGIATPEMIEQYRLGLVDRTVPRALRGCSARDARRLRVAWQARDTCSPTVVSGTADVSSYRFPGRVPCSLHGPGRCRSRR